MRFTSKQVACKRPWNHYLILSALRGTIRGLHPAAQIYHMQLELYMDISQSKLIFLAVDLNYMKKRKCHWFWYPL